MQINILYNANVNVNVSNFKNCEYPARLKHFTVDNILVSQGLMQRNVFNIVWNR